MSDLIKIEHQKIKYIFGNLNRVDGMFENLLNLRIGFLQTISWKNMEKT